MKLSNPFDFEQWRRLLNLFDDARHRFYEALDFIQRDRGATDELEAERQKLLSEAGPIIQNIDNLMNALASARDFLTDWGGIFRRNNLGAGPAAPIAIAVSLGSAYLIVDSITKWLSRVAKYSSDNKLAKNLADAGASPQEIIEAVQSRGFGGDGSRIFGFDVRWLALIGALVFVVPPLLKRTN